MNFDRLKNRWRSVSLCPLPSETSLPRLFEKYDSARFEDFFNGQASENEFGVYYRFFREELVSKSPASWEKKLFPLLFNLKLVSGIGDKTNEKLKQSGYRSVLDLYDHPRFGKASAEFQEALHRENLSVMLSYCRSRIGYNHPDLLYLSTFHSPRQLCFIDIETLGLYNCPLFLIGLARWNGTGIQITQYLAPSIMQERAILAACQKEVEPGTILVTYNGDSFDIPFINDRLRLYQLPAIPRSPSYDMLLYVRWLWRNKLPDCRLQTVESHMLGRNRKDDVPGNLVPSYYQAYLTRGNIGPLIPILEHNQLDLLSLMEIFFTMLQSDPCQKWCRGRSPEPKKDETISY